MTSREGIYTQTKKLTRGQYRGERGLYEQIEKIFLSGVLRDQFSELTGLMFPSGEQATEKTGT